MTNTTANPYQPPKVFTEYFFLGFEAPQELGPSPSHQAPHVTLMGYISLPEGVTPERSLAEHLDAAAIQAQQLRARGVMQMGKHVATLFHDHNSKNRATAKAFLESLLADGYVCSRPSFYRSKKFKLHASHTSPETSRIDTFDLANVAITASRFEGDYNFLDAEVIHTVTL